jgi:LmbE family N-acetylglucosaminyl deacetylase
VIVLNKRIVIFAPHPDDETLGCGGTIAKKVSEGYEVIIAVMTGGKRALLDVSGVEFDPTPEELKQIREKEIVSATSILGVKRENLLFFDFEDGILADHEEELEKKVTALLKNPPAEVYFPYAKDFNADHQTANKVIVSSIRKISSSTLRYQYSIAQKFSRVGPLVARALNPIRRNLIFVDVSHFLHLKEAAIKQYKSQISIISAKQERPVVEKFERFLKNKEAFYLG